MNNLVGIPHSRPWITRDDQKAVEAVLNSGMVSQGSLTKQFEQRICEYVSASFGKAVSSGTAALILALKSLNIKNGEGVILPNYVCRSVLDAVVYVGAQPQICDVNESGVMTEETVGKVINSNTRAIVAVHIFGNPCDILSLRKFKTLIIEDACQAFGLKINGQIAGAIGDCGIFSFHATKCLTTGEGGMVVTNSEDIGNKLHELQCGPYGCSHQTIAPLSDLQSALGLSQLERFPEFISKRKALLDRYKHLSDELQLELTTSKSSNLPFRFVVKHNGNFSDIRQKMESFGINVRRGVDCLLSQAFNGATLQTTQSSDNLHRNLSLPFYPSLTNSEFEKIKDALVNSRCLLK